MIFFLSLYVEVSVMRPYLEHSLKTLFCLNMQLKLNIFGCEFGRCPQVASTSVPAQNFAFSFLFFTPFGGFPLLVS